jgi:hypothetical protein
VDSQPVRTDSAEPLTVDWAATPALNLALQSLVATFAANKSLVDDNAAATNAWGLVDKLVQGAAQTKVLAGRPGEMHPFAKIFPRLIGTAFMVMGCVALVIGIWNL